jgi:osmoprotectant transport system substrate-binding protein
MPSLLHALKSKALIFLTLLSLLVLAGCGGSSAPASSGSTTGASSNADITITVASKDDPEAQLLGQMYALLLTHAGYKVNQKLKLGGNAIVFSAISSGAIDVYPEFTATGLAKLGLKTSHNVQTDYQTVKDGYEKNYKITWLDLSPLNDTYGFCTSKANADKYHLTKISDLAPIASKLTLATPPDGKTDPSVLPAVKPAYGFEFGKVNVLDAAITYEAVSQGKADVNICYTTSALITKDNFVLLQDDKNLFPIYQPSPIIRDATLSKSPAIGTTLNKLAPLLTTSISSQLQLQVLNGETVHDVAQKFLKDKGLL